MSITSSIVLLAAIWFLCLLIILPIGIQTQSDKGKITRGTPGSAPADAIIKKKFKQTTVISFIIWIIICGIILSDMITIYDIDLYRRFNG